MPKICASCSYYSAEGEEQACPECGTALQFTMLGPPNAPSEMEDESEVPAWACTETAKTEVLEQPLGVRMAQIGTGIAFYFLVWRWGSAFLRFCFADLLCHAEDNVAIITAGVISIVLYIVAALAAGAMAGAWTVNWVPQGLGVAAGLLIIPLVLLLFVWPESLPFYLAVVFVTTCITVGGAYLGHLLIQPSKFIL